MWVWEMFLRKKLIGSPKGIDLRLTTRHLGTNTSGLYIESSDGIVAKSSANGLVGIGFTSRYWLQPRVGFYESNGLV